jgi:hypothetical protein
MTCESCREAGTRNMLRNLRIASEDSFIKEGADVPVSEIVAFHEKCENIRKTDDINSTWCACQHKIGHYVGTSGRV